MIARILKYWDTTKYNVKWEIAYRKRDTKGFEKFRILNLPKGKWGADPFLVQDNNGVFLFYEEYEESQKKGSIAVAAYEDGKFTRKGIVIDEPFHLSFPCVFKIRDDYYMIPESGAVESLILYKCENYPYKWKKEKILANGKGFSDTLVIEKDEVYYVIASILVDGSCCALNKMYTLNPETLELCDPLIISEPSTNGIRNAGYYVENTNIYRSGQNSPNNEYGKSIKIFSVDCIDKNNYHETPVCDITANDYYDNCGYCGLHTLNKSQDFEVVDLKTRTINSHIKRIHLFLLIVRDYIWGKIERGLTKGKKR